MELTATVDFAGRENGGREALFFLVLGKRKRKNENEKVGVEKMTGAGISFAE